MSRWESKGKQDVAKILKAPRDRQKVIEVRGVDQTNLRLLAWSIIWRASVSKGVATSRVDLGATEEEARQGLIGEGLDSSSFPVLLVRRDGSEAARRTIFLPHPFEILGIRGFKFLACGVDWFLPTSRKRADWLREELPWLGTTTELEVVVVDGNDNKFLDDLRHLIGEQGMW